MLAHRTTLAPVCASVSTHVCSLGNRLCWPPPLQQGATSLNTPQLCLPSFYLVLNPNRGLFPDLLGAPQELRGGHGFLALVLSQQEAWGLGHTAHKQQHERGGRTAQHGQPAPLQDPAWKEGVRRQSWSEPAWPSFPHECLSPCQPQGLSLKGGGLTTSAWLPLCLLLIWSLLLLKCCRNDGDYICSVTIYVAIKQRMRSSLCNDGYDRAPFV